MKSHVFFILYIDFEFIFFNGKYIFKISFCILKKKKEANRALVTYCDVNWNSIITILFI